MIKLNIEMSMAALIGKIARSSDGSTPSGPSVPGEIKLSNAGRRGRGRYGRSSRSGKDQEAGYEDASDRLSPGRKRFDPTVSEILAEGHNGDGERMYHAWVSADGRRFSEVQRGEGGRENGGGNGLFGGRARGRGSSERVDEEGIRKETEVRVTEEPAGSRREPSEDGSTVRLT
jgi:hypothetical protein